MVFCFYSSEESGHKKNNTNVRNILTKQLRSSKLVCYTMHKIFMILQVGGIAMLKRPRKDHTNLLIFLMSFAAGVPFTFLALRIADVMTEEGMKGIFSAIFAVWLMFLVFVGILMVLGILIAEGRGDENDE